MTYRFGRIALALCAPFILMGCLLTPGKFASTLSVNADRSFTFTYKGEVIAMDPAGDMAKGMKEDTKDDEETPVDEDASFQPALLQEKSGDEETDAETEEDKERKRHAVAVELAKEAGYRSVQYLGKGKYLIDYAITGRLDHSFVYPYNLDAEIIFPFLAIEVRKNGTVRIKAPAFGNESGNSNTPGRDEASKLIDGTFTFDTNAEIVSQNNEDGVQTLNGRKTITWKATPISKGAPTAVLRMVR